MFYYNLESNAENDYLSHSFLFSDWNIRGKASYGYSIKRKLSRIYLYEISEFDSDAFLFK